MSRSLSIFLVLFLVVVLTVFIYLLTMGGLKEYVRAIVLINKMDDAKKSEVWSEFSGTDARGAERGLLAGTWLDRVWVWTSTGIKSYKTDMFSVYSLFDGCSDKVIISRKNGERNAIRKSLYTDLSLAFNYASPGDYVVIYVGKPANDGEMGVLREMYIYNFWLFMNDKMDIECGK